MENLNTEEYQGDSEDEIILLDVRRTYPNLVFFPKGMLVNILRNIRRQFVPNTCYYQGLNYLVAYLMTKVDNADLVYRLACTILKNHMSKYIGIDLSPLKKAYYTLQRLV